MPLAYIALGANLDDPLGQLRAALDAVAAHADARRVAAARYGSARFLNSSFGARFENRKNGCSALPLHAL